MRPILRSLLVVCCLATPAAAQRPVIEKVDPPNWWAGHSVNPVRLLIHGLHLAGARFECARLGCSDVDSHIPAGRVEESAARLAELGADVTMRLYPGMGHTINRDELDHVQRGVDAMLAGSPGPAR